MIKEDDYCYIKMLQLLSAPGGQQLEHNARNRSDRTPPLS